MPRVFFAHQSVGTNILDGLADVQGGSDRAALDIVGLDQGMPDGRPFICHARLGRNGDPRSKTDAFVAALADGVGASIDVAFQKYCYADIDAATDVDALFDYYRRAMEAIRRRLPHLTLLDATVPLRQVEEGPKAVVKKWLGRAPDHYADNVVRERFNDRIRHEYRGRGLFDLAQIEASAPGEVPHTQRFGSTRVLSLRPEYTDDGGHLNQRGGRHVARALVDLLFDPIRSQRTLC